MTLSSADITAITEQLGREPRGVHSIVARCACGEPAVVRTYPRLPDGTPFPTTYYVTCSALNAAIGRLESSGVMREMEQQLAENEELAAAYARAHEQYLAARAELGVVEEIDGISAGGMPTRVKCLHVLVGHSLACGPGVNPLGDQALTMIGAWCTDA